MTKNEEGLLSSCKGFHLRGIPNSFFRFSLVRKLQKRVKLRKGTTGDEHTDFTFSSSKVLVMSLHSITLRGPKKVLGIHQQVQLVPMSSCDCASLLPANPTIP
jgi:hypothetical protein